VAADQSLEGRAVALRQVVGQKLLIHHRSPSGPALRGAGALARILTPKVPRPGGSDEKFSGIPQGFAASHAGAPSGE